MAEEIFDLQNVAYLKRKFNPDLVPIMEMLTHSKSAMKVNEWMNFIERTRLSVTAHPNQYLHGDLPEKSIFTILPGPHVFAYVVSGIKSF